MAEEIKTNAIPEVKTEVKEEPKVDLVTRVSQLKTEPPKEEPDNKFNINDLDTQIDGIQDPKLKEQVLGLKKSLLKGENQKYQEIANLRKQYETKLAEVSGWNPERLKQELAKPDFMQAANEILQSKEEDKYSALSDAEKAEFNQLKQRVALQEQQNWQSLKMQQDAQLKGKYANYDPNIVDDITKNMMTGKIQGTREDLWKVIDYENAVKRAYELGLQDKKSQDMEKINGMSYAEGRNIASPSSVERQKGETIDSFMRRSYAEHSKKK